MGKLFQALVQLDQGQGVLFAVLEQILPFSLGVLPVVPAHGQIGESDHGGFSLGDGQVGIGHIRNQRGEGALQRNTAAKTRVVEILGDDLLEVYDALRQRC